MKNEQNVIIDAMRTHFHVLFDGPFFMEKLLLYLNAPTILGKCA